MIHEKNKKFGISLVAMLAAALAASLSPAAAQQPGAQGEIRSLPAAASPPPDVAEQMKLEKQKIPPPPPRGKGAGKALPAAAAPPPDVAQMIEEEKRKVPNPPGKARQEALLEIIKKRPGGAERVDKARRGYRPDNPGQGRPTSAVDHVLRGIGSVFVREAHAGQTFTLELTPATDAGGRHASLYSSTPYGRANFYCALVNSYDPSNDRIRLLRFTSSAIGSSCANPYVYLHTNIPAAGYYIININAYSYAPVTIRHYAGSGQYPVLETLPQLSGWADYPTLQYLQPGYHTFYFVLPNGGYVSRLTVDSYP